MTEANQGQQHSVEGDDASPPEPPEDFTIAIYSDPGRTSMWMRRLLDEKGEGWSQGATITHNQALIPLRTDKTLNLEAVQKWAQNEEADVTVIVTEIPRMAGREPKLAELHLHHGLAIISFPALGPVGLRRGLRRELRRSVQALIAGSVDHQQETGGLFTYVEDDHGERTYYTTPRKGFPGRVWTTLGMVAANEPIAALPKLSGIFAASVATSAFGVFYSTIWELAIAMPIWRLSLVSLVAVTIMVLWLIVFNRLWDKPGAMSGKREALMYNASTAVSLTFSVAVIYTALFVAVLCMAMLLIDPDFMVDNTGEEASFINYTYIAWLAASLGTTAGAIGSNFDSQANLKSLTQGSRELQRYPRDDEQA